MDVNLDDIAGVVRAQEEGRAVEIVNPLSGEKLGLTIVVAGPDSQRFRAGQRAVVRERLSDGTLEASTDDQNVAGNMQITAASVVSWSPNPVLGGKALECTADNALAVFLAIPSIFDQCFAVVVDRQGFLTR